VRGGREIEKMQILQAECVFLSLERRRIGVIGPVFVVYRVLYNNTLKVRTLYAESPTLDG